MRAYKFLNEKYALLALRDRRIKESRISELNDPFELRPYDLTQPGIRQAFLMTRDEVGRDRGIACFSGSWSNPVLWAHYSENHKGLCLGFEVPEAAGNPDTDEFCHVKYIAKPLPFPHDFLSWSDSERFKIVKTILFTKFDHWGYESEIRVWAPLQNESKGINYFEFDEKLRLLEVIIGANSKLTRREVITALGSFAGGIKVCKARPAYDSFEMVEDETF